MKDKHAEIIEYAEEHPNASMRAIAAALKMSKSTVCDHLNERHQAADSGIHRALSGPQELELVARINDYALKGVRLPVRHVRQLAERVYGAPLGDHWTSRFFERHADVLRAGYFRFQESARVKANTPETREGFTNEVSIWSHCGRVWLTSIRSCMRMRSTISDLVTNTTWTRLDRL